MCIQKTSAGDSCGLAFIYEDRNISRLVWPDAAAHLAVLRLANHPVVQFCAPLCNMQR